MMDVPDDETLRLLTPAEVAAIFRVGVRTVAGWARDGKLDAVQTPGGHRRFRSEDVNALVRARAQPRQSSVTREITDRMVQEMDR